MMSKKDLILKAVFIVQSLVWFFFSFEFDNKAGDLGDSAFRAVKGGFSTETGVSGKARAFCVGFAVVLVILAVVFAVGIAVKKKAFYVASSVIEFAGVLFMTCRFQFNSNGYGNITYIPSMVLLFIIAFRDLKRIA